MTQIQLRVPAHHVSPRARWYWATRAMIGWVVVIVVETVAWLTTPDSGAGLIVLLAITAFVAATHLVVMPRWRFHVHRWEATDDAVYTQSGWFTQERRIAPVNRIQTVDTHRGPFEQLFGLSNVTVTTASASGPLHINGLDLATALTLVDDLTARTSTQGDGT